MGVYIKGMEMPKDYSVIVKIFPDGRVGTIPYVQWFKVELIEGTQAFPVPPHGDLIDRDAARESIKPWSPEDERNGCTFDTVKKLMRTMLNRALTIIPAEEGEA